MQICRYADMQIYVGLITVLGKADSRQQKAEIYL
jgi:hypothetical protein